jgi:hypothetical protein
MKCIFSLAFFSLLLAMALDVQSADARSKARIDAGCMYVLSLNDVTMGDYESDWVMNYHGCDEVYDDDGTLVGYGRGDTTCERRAYTLSIRHGYYGYNLHRRMGGCVLYEDWSWGRE